MWGGICQTLANERKTHMSSSFVLFQPPSVNNFYWQLREVMVVNCFGSGVAGLSVHASMHTPPLLTSLTQEISTLTTILSVFSSRIGSQHFLVSRRHFSWLHKLLNTHALKFCVLLVVCSPTDKNGASFPHAGPPLLFIPHRVGLFLTHRIFHGFPADAVS